ncbi:hypothetical protein BSKO_09336 [Bryopsis sp. KO-2023]|nr:hypothetical protein BSKO_09336 [Bryopsis sp. KO-2023]
MLALQDEFKQPIDQAEAVSCLAKLLSSKDYRARFNATGALRNLAFDDEILERILAFNPPEELANVWTPIGWKPPSTKGANIPKSEIGRQPSTLSQPQLDFDHDDA